MRALIVCVFVVAATAAAAFEGGNVAAARAAYGKHYNYLLSERAMDLLRGLMSPRPTEAK